jgi:hypothetical protein
MDNMGGLVLVHLKQQPIGNISMADLLIAFLVRFPAIFTLNYNLAEAKFRFSFIITKVLEQEKYLRFRKILYEHLKTYYEILNLEEPTYPKIRKSVLDSWTLLEITWTRENISLEEVNLTCSVLLNEFKNNVLIDLRDENCFVNDAVKEDDFIEYLLFRKNEKEEESLFAFRESGKVFVYDK